MPSQAKKFLPPKYNFLFKNSKLCRLISSTADSARRDHLLLLSHDFFPLCDGDDGHGDMAMMVMLMVSTVVVKFESQFTFVKVSIFRFCKLLAQVRGYYYLKKFYTDLPSTDWLLPTPTTSKYKKNFFFHWFSRPGFSL